MASKLIGEVILDQYKVEEFIDGGGTGSVYRVWDIKRNVSLAMKVLHADLAEDEVMFKRFEREARALQKLAHPNIIPFYGLKQTRDFVFLLEKFIDGPTLKDYLKNQGRPLTEFEMLTFFKAICSALGYAHNNGVIHCDVKAANVMIDRGGNIYLADFGIARHADSSVTTMAGAGTPAYMAPEQIETKSLSPATDIYSLGVLLFEVLTGQRPFRGTERGTESAGGTANERIRYAHLKLEPPDPLLLNPSLKPDVGKVILKALEKDPKKRFQSCNEFLTQLCLAIGVSPDQIADRININIPISIPPSPGQPNSLAGHPSLPPVPPSKRAKKNVWVFVAIAVAVVIVLVFSMSGNPPPPPVAQEIVNTPYIQPSKTYTNTAPEIDQPAVEPSPTIFVEPTSTRRINPTDTAVITNSCPGAEPQRVRVGDKVTICTKSDRVIVRYEPKPGDNELFRIYPGTDVKIINGPECSDDSSWWMVRVPAGIIASANKGKNNFTLENESTGWIREGSDNVDLYYICKIP